jgi:hypothetical protein
MDDCETGSEFDTCHLNFIKVLDDALVTGESFEKSFAFDPAVFIPGWAFIS